MGMTVQSSGARGGGFRRRRRPVAEINMTPMIDVMLVLLVIFMVTAPLLTTGVSVDLPRAKAPQISEPDNKALTVSVAADGQVYLNQTPISLELLPARVRAIAGVNPDVRIYVRADGQLQYGVVMHILGSLHAAGFSKAALVTQTPAASAVKR
ncbi:ExbD/TolR family protein [Haematospirillum jordaniae]|uniref:Protein TolR n=2 Tax=Haematospirillum TaxID=1804663 RepID=A0A143DE87_9PROT|nr:ExbD/TolR family protein [Haematospirillum jordaniae]NKD76276.1 ExbD/TolR family protein [Haematospirillum sp. H1815]AMW35044.1 protein TolR [Haematospirillum jordaniae]NKD44215.1 ExbD/TolR family protein [Haematospirillum jordaniae]NKD56593.1 ExbD/TolR family protein [Haematospirillum jordaniae]NKD58651.1 ExbD/TolR family protein [Haematospirillum jordaniae]